MSDTIGNKLSREKDLLLSLPSHVPEGIRDAIDDAWQHKERTAIEAVSAVALGTVLTLASRNPNHLVQKGLHIAGMSFVGFAGVDLANRFYSPMADTWQNPNNLEKNKKWLGDNIGDAVVNYGMAIVAGGVGAHFAEHKLAGTRFGEIISGQKVSHFDAKGMNGFESVQDKFDGYSQTFLKTKLSETNSPKMNFTVREFNNGSKLISSSDGLSVLRTGAGDETWYKTTHSWGSLKPKVEQLSTELRIPGSDFQIKPRSVPRTDFEPPAPSNEKFDIGKLTSKLLAWEYGGEGGFGTIASTYAFERAADVGAAIIQHYYMEKHSPDHETKPKSSEVGKKTTAEQHK